MNKSIIYFGIIVSAIITIGLFIIFGQEMPGDPPSQEMVVLKTIDNLDKRVFYIYAHKEGFGEDFTLPFRENYKLCFFNSSNPSQTATWDPEATTKYLINQSGFNVWYYRGEDDAAGHGKIISHLDMPTEKNFCSVGGTKIYLISTGKGVEISPQ